MLACQCMLNLRSKERFDGELEVYLNELYLTYDTDNFTAWESTVLLYYLSLALENHVSAEIRLQARAIAGRMSGSTVPPTCVASFTRRIQGRLRLCSISDSLPCNLSSLTRN